MRLRNHQGAAAIEFAVVFPILLLILLGIIEFSFILYDKAVISNACREGARAGIVQQSPRVSASQIEATVKNCSSHLINFRGGSITPTVSTSNAPCTDFGDNLTVTATFHYNFFSISNFVPMLASGVDLTAQSVMKCE
jgi:Flp pilus assembly protein TadG